MTIDKQTAKLLSHPAKRRAWVRYQLTLKGVSMATIAAQHGVTRQCLYQAFCKTYPRMEKIIADAVGLPAPVLWPERYGADGLPLYRMGRPIGSGKKSISKHNTRRIDRNVDDAGGNGHRRAA